MVVLLSNRKSKLEKEIVKILKKYGTNYISDKVLTENDGNFTIATIYKKTEILLNKGIVVFTEKSHHFKEQKLPIGIIGVCEENDRSAFEILKNNRNAVITCGINNKNTITLSSIGENTLLATLQRSIYDIGGNFLEPCEFKITLSENYSPFSVMSATVILLYHGIIPDVF